MDQSAELLRPETAFGRRPVQSPDSPLPGDGHRVEAPALATLAVCAKGLCADDQTELERLFCRDEAVSPRLVAVEPADHASADVILIDGRNADARNWWRENRALLHRRPMVWMDQRSPYEAHTTLVRPVVWSLIPLILYRAAQVAQERNTLVPRQRSLKKQAVVVVSPRGIAGAQLRWMLDTLGYRTTLAVTAQEGLAALHAAPYDAVILVADPLAPAIDVPAICKRIRGLERRIGRLPVVVLNKDVSAWQRLRARLAGSVEFSPWPVHVPELAVLLESLPAATRPSRRCRASA